MHDGDRARESTSRIDPERWKLIDSLLQSALEQEPAQRPAFLIKACEGDDALLQEVESLISAHHQAGDFLESPPVNITSHPHSADRSAELPGRTLGPYEVLSLVGRGGMGEVYRGIDRRLDRFVAIKFLPPHLSDNTEFRLRFEREARVLASLNHPTSRRFTELNNPASASFSSWNSFPEKR